MKGVRRFAEIADCVTQVTLTSLTGDKFAWQRAALCYRRRKTCKQSKNKGHLGSSTISARQNSPSTLS